jgi:hypothetical protein
VVNDANPDWLDPDEFPFTGAELTSALVLWSSHPGCEQLAEAIAEGLRESRVERERALAALARGSRDLEEINHGIFLFPSEVWALMAELSADHAERVEAFRRERQRQQHPQRLARAMSRAGLSADASPTAAVVAEIDSEDRATEVEWQEFRAQVRRDVLGSAGREGARVNSRDDG